MSLKLRLGILLQDSLPAQGIAPHVCVAIVHHLSQHVGAIVLRPGSVTVYYLTIENVTVESSNGRGMFLGPMKTGTAAEKDNTAAALQSMPQGFRERLDAPSGVIVAVTATESQKAPCSAVVELTGEDLRRLAQATQ